MSQHGKAPYIVKLAYAGGRDSAPAAGGSWGAAPSHAPRGGGGYHSRGGRGRGAPAVEVGGYFAAPPIPPRQESWGEDYADSKY